MSQSISSLELLERCHEKGLLSKEAYDRVHAYRKELIKEAMARAVGQALKKGVGKLTGKKPPVPAAPPPKNTFLGALSKGGITPSKGSGPETGWGDITSNLGKVLLLAGLTAGGMSGISAIGSGIKRSALNHQIDRSYKDMFKEFPELRERNPNVVRSHFGVLRRYAPSLAANPIVAGSFVRSTAGQGHIDPNTVHMLAQTQSALSNYADKPMQHGLAAAKMIGGALS